MINYGRKKAVLVLENGETFEGWSFGAERSSSGETVFNTGMTGYPETLTDPSYRGQIIVMTFPLIGNYGVPDESQSNGVDLNFESDRIHATGLITADYSENFGHYSTERSLEQWLKEQGIPAVSGVDTRKLTKMLRDHGSMSGKIIIDEKDVPFDHPNDRNLVDEVSIKEEKVYEAGSKKIALIDCGVKNNIIRAFRGRDITVIRYPWDYDFSREDVDGILISNGPGDPKMCVETIENTKKALKRNIPVLGICLGSQILALAAGAQTYKQKYGHRGHNQPVVEMGTKRCYITSQNHGYAIDSQTLPLDWRIWFENANDGTNEGIFHISKPFFGTQFHPEASPGPDDTEIIFDMFVRAMQ